MDIFNFLFSYFIYAIPEIPFWATPRGAQASLLALHSRLTADDVQGTISDAIDQTRVAACKACLL